MRSSFQFLQVNPFDTERYHARQDIAQDWNLQQDSQEEGQTKGLARVQRARDNSLLDLSLEPLDDARRSFAFPLHFTKVTLFHPFGLQLFGENIRRDDRILNGVVDADPAHWRHDVRRVSD
jgi:hypothetical protein